MMVHASLLLVLSAGAPPDLERVVLDPSGRGFLLETSRRPFVPWGFNYDHDERGRLIEEYWEAEWPKVVEDFQEMKDLGANVARIHLQLGKFCPEPGKVDPRAMERLGKLIELAEETGIHLDLTGLGSYLKPEVPAWYDALSEEGRWEAQAVFWEAVAERAARSPALFFYDLMNEPVVPGGKRGPGEWLGPPFAEKYHYVQFITLDQAGRKRPDVARAWTARLRKAVRRRDPRGLVTAGLVDWSLDRPGLTSGFVPSVVAPEMDLLAVHLYPKSGKLEEAMETLKGFAAAGKPVVIEETFPLQCSLEEFDRFLEASRAHAAGWIGFYWGKTIEECRRSSEIRDHIIAAWLERFRKGPPGPRAF